MKNRIKLAVLYFCYNREDHLKQSLPNVLRFRDELPLFIFCDGPKDLNDSETGKVKSYLKRVMCDIKNCKIIYREENLGLAKNIIFGVNHVFNLDYDTITVLEDDCVPSSNYFDYMKNALSYYLHHRNVMHVSAFGLPLKSKPTKDSYIAPYPCSWGWGTWKEKWIECNFHDTEYYNKILSDKEILEVFNWSGKSFSYFLTLQIRGNINSWLIRWYAHIFKNKGVCVWATDSKLYNIGFDGSGQHKVKYDIYNQKQIDKCKSFDFHDDTSTFNTKIIKQFRQFFMGPSFIDKLKTLLYINTGLLIERLRDVSNYYQGK